MSAGALKASRRVISDCCSFFPFRFPAQSVHNPVSADHPDHSFVCSVYVLWAHQKLRTFKVKAVNFGVGAWGCTEHYTDWPMQSHGVLFCFHSPSLVLLCAIGSLFLIIALAVYRHQHPINLYLLLGFVSRVFRLHSFLHSHLVAWRCGLNGLG